MPSKARNSSLVFCRFEFLFVIIGGGLHLNPGGAFVAAATGTPLVICVFNRKSDRVYRQEKVLPATARKEVTFVSSKTDKSD